MFEQIDDLVIDIPDVHLYLAQFLARAVADEILPPVFLKNKDASHLSKDVILRAQVRHEVEVRMSLLRWHATSQIAPITAGNVNPMHEMMPATRNYVRSAF